MVEAQIDAFVGASKVEDPAAIRCVNPAAPRFSHGDGGITFLRGPALHEVPGLVLGKSLGIHRSQFGPVGIVDFGRRTEEKRIPGLFLGASLYHGRMRLESDVRHALIPPPAAFSQRAKGL